MSSLHQSLNRLRKFRAQTEATDPALAEESRDTGSDITTEAAFGAASAEAQIDRESIIQRRNRPALRVMENTAELQFRDPVESEVWQQRLTTAKPLLDKAITAVGRIDLINSPDFSWVGTGWLLDDDIIVTNRHVAELFVSTQGRRLQFTQSGSEDLIPQIDFIREFNSNGQNAFELLEPLYIVPKPGPDMALFRVAQTGSNGNLPHKIALATKPATTAQAATIGYPAYDSRIPDAELMTRIYGLEYDKKRLAPGAVKTVTGSQIAHDCTTLGGNSGSVIIDMQRDDNDLPVAVGLHFAGAFLKANYAVPSDLMASVLNSVKRGDKPYATPARPDTHKDKPVQPATGDQAIVNAPIQPVGTSFTIPLNVTVSLGDAQATVSQAAATPPTPSAPALQQSNSEPDDDIDLFAETQPADYANRNGYIENFIGSGDMVVPMPTVNDKHDVLTFVDQGVDSHVLRYQNFSVIMKASRRLLYISAVNLDGTRMQRVTRPRWRLDPRIPRDSQIIKECYGRSPRFSRGHMTRKNDAGWGDNRDIAVRGVTDTMHVTNAAPQMQAFNAPIWLELEDYALDNAIRDSMRICVFTGPYFTDSDPLRFGVEIPVSFWKVIAFKHDVTGELTATGYEMDQIQSLPEEEFVFGAFTSTRLNVAAQVAISQIEQKSGIDFGLLRDADPMASVAERIGQQRKPLQRRSEIKYF